MKAEGQILIEGGFGSAGSDRHILIDRRKKPTPTLSRYIFFLGRRRIFRRKADQEKGGYLDHYRFPSLRIPIRVKLSIAITAIIWLTILILSFVILARQRDHLYLQTVKTGKVSLNYFVNNANIPLLNDDLLRLNQLIKEAASTEGLLYAIIVDRQQIIKAHTDQTKIGGTLQAFEDIEAVKRDGNVTYFNYTLPSGIHVLNLSRPVMFKDKELGVVHVGVSIDFIKDLIHRETIFILILSLLIILLGISIAILLDKRSRYQATVTRYWRFAPNHQKVGAYKACL
jgi:sensor histidine kinase regulating citrate/malate metabolism